MATEDELLRARKAHVERLRDAGGEAFPNDFRVTPSMETSRRNFLALTTSATPEDLPEEDDLPADPDDVSLWGRVVAKRGPFLVLRTPYGDGQTLVRKERLSERESAMLKVVDLGDHVAVTGPAIRTRTGNAAVSARTYRHVGKALLPPPAKWHGLKDIEKRYRERYVDLFANPGVADVFRARSVTVSSLRTFLDDRGFLEVETPVLQSVRGGATARPFGTHHNALDIDLFLRVAPELYLKRLLVGGLERVYELGRTFRNEGISTRHNPEFTMLEFYMAYATYEDLLDLTVEMLKSVDHVVRSAYPLLAEERPFTFEENWPRVTMRRAVQDRLAIGEGGEALSTPWARLLPGNAVFDESEVARVWEEGVGLSPREARAELTKATSYGKRIVSLFELLAEPELTRLYRTRDDSSSVPVFITEYPFEVSPLSRRNDEDPRFVDRFELFVEGRELVNAFSELNDPDDQAERFRAQLDNRQQGDEEAMDFDADYIRALSHGMPPAAGFGLGVDRLVMLLTGQTSIRDVLLFPLLRPEGG